MARVLKRGGVWYAKWTDANGKPRCEAVEAASEAAGKALATSTRPGTGGHADLILIGELLLPILQHQLEHAPRSLVPVPGRVPALSRGRPAEGAAHRAR